MMTLATAWQPFVPSRENEWDMDMVAHLHRRAGFGGTWRELQRDLRDGPKATVDRFLNPPSPSVEEIELLETFRKGIRTGPDKHDRLQAYWFHRLLFHPDVLREKLTIFWHNHFATSNQKVRDEVAMLGQNELFREHALGDFRALAAGIVRDPAMLVWLDGANTTKDAPNENLGRELLELFTLGEGNFAERDVRAAARALTGWVQDPSDYGTTKFRYDAMRFDNGSKTFLGKVGNWNSRDTLRIIFDSPHCAEFICRKLYRFFVSETNAPADLIQSLARRFRESDYSIKAIVETILRSNHFYSSEVRRQKVSSPVELTVGFLRSFEVPRRDVRLPGVANTCRLQGQELFYPLSVAGWAGGKTWINSITVLERSRWITNMIWGNHESAHPMPVLDVQRWLSNNGVAPTESGSTLLAITVQDSISDKAKSLVLKTVATGKADDIRKGIQIVAHCPEFQLV